MGSPETRGRLGWEEVMSLKLRLERDKVISRLEEAGREGLGEDWEDAAAKTTVLAEEPASRDSQLYFRTCRVSEI